MPRTARAQGLVDLRRWPDIYTLVAVARDDRRMSSVAFFVESEMLGLIDRGSDRDANAGAALLFYDAAD